MKVQSLIIKLNSPEYPWWKDVLTVDRSELAPVIVYTQLMNFLATLLSLITHPAN